MLPVFKPPLDFNISTNHLYTTGQAVAGVNVIFHLVDKLKINFKGDIRPFDENANAELKRYSLSVVYLEYLNLSRRDWNFMQMGKNQRKRI
jgi:hypothetical protein